jgi:hypothetical protein
LQGATELIIPNGGGVVGTAIVGNAIVQKPFVNEMMRYGGNIT